MSTISGIRSGPLVGSGWALTGTVLYFCEWVAIVAAGGIPTFLATDASLTKVTHAYAGHESAYGWAAGWFAVVLLGRVVFAVAVRRCLVREPDTREDVRVLADLGVLLMAVGMVLETCSYAFVAAAASLADHGAPGSALRTLDVVGRDLNGLLWGPTGASVLCLAVAMWLDGRFARVLAGIGIVAGALLVVESLGFQAPRFSSVASALQALAILFWIWMIWTAVLLFLRRSRRSQPAVVSS